jgi:amino acid permease
LGCTAANLINAIVGANIVGIPYAVKMAGFGQLDSDIVVRY